MGILQEMSQNPIVMKRSTLLIAVLMSACLSGISQIPTYILQREAFNPGVSSINFSPIKRN
jgi:hypothetical protein